MTLDNNQPATEPVCESSQEQLERYKKLGVEPPCDACGSKLFPDPPPSRLVKCRNADCEMFDEPVVALIQPTTDDGEGK